METVLPRIDQNRWNIKEKFVNTQEITLITQEMIMEAISKLQSGEATRKDELTKEMIKYIRQQRIEELWLTYGL